MTIKKIKMFLLGCYFLILPIDTALGNLIGNMSFTNYLILIYFFLFTTEFLAGSKKNNIIINKVVTIAIFLAISYITTIIWNVRDINKILRETEIYSFVLSVLFYIVLSFENFNEKDKKKIYRWIYLSGITVFVSYIYTRLTGYNLDGRFALNLGRYFDPNYFGVGLNLLVLVIVNNLCQKNNVLVNSIYLIAIVFIILSTGSRGALLTLSSSNLIYLLIKYRKKFHKAIIWGSIFIVILLVFVNMSDSVFTDGLLERFKFGTLIEDGGSGRATYWKSAIEYYNMYGNIFRYLFGFGAFSFPIATLTYLGFEAAPHSIYVQTLFESGIVGITILFTLFLYNFKKSIKNKNLLMTCALIGLLVSGLSLDVIRTRYFWSVLFLNNINLTSIYVSRKKDGKK